MMFNENDVGSNVVPLDLAQLFVNHFSRYFIDFAQYINLIIEFSRFFYKSIIEKI